MKVAVASDHRAYELKTAILKWLAEQGFEGVDYGGSGERVEYPEVAGKAAQAVAHGECSRAIICCGSGIGVSIVANKVRGVRAALVQDAEEARLSRQHNDCNVLCMGSLRVTPEAAPQIAAAWFAADFEGGRHAKRVGMIAELEAHEASAAATDEC